MLTCTKALLLFFITVLFSACRQHQNQAGHLALPHTLVYNDSSVIVFPEREDSGLFRHGLDKRTSQQFIVKHTKSSLIKTTRGLKIKVDPSALEREDGLPITGDIAVEVIELTNSSELFKANAATVSDGKLLMSGGSYFVGMTSGNSKIRVKQGKAIMMDIPVINDAEMELFYGKRNSNGDMNWVSAGQPLQQELEDINFERQQVYPEIKPPMLKIKHHLFNSVKSTVYYNNRLTTIEDMLKQLQARGLDRIIDTVYYSWSRYNKGNVVYSRDSFPYACTFKGYQLRLISGAESLAEKDSMRRAYEDYRCALKEREENPVTLAGSLKKYYAPAAISELGWINCDRFYKNNNSTNLELELPITMNNSRVNYFIIFKSFSGLLNGRLDLAPAQSKSIENLPVGEKITLVAFIKSKGLLYQFSKDMTIEKNSRIPLDLKRVSEKELKKMFGVNVRV